LGLRHQDQESVLEAGDAAYFDASAPHAYRCAGSKPARAIIVTMHQPAPLRVAAV
jgi:quercetin dioxygenase-like cupin family protein